MKRILAGVLCVLLPMQSVQASDIDTLVARAAASAPKQALGVAYAIGPGAPVVRVSGPVSRSGDVPVAAEAPWHIGSITKSFTAALIQRLVAQGVVSLDAPIGTYLPADRAEMHGDWQAVTLRQLLSHTARLPANPPRGTLQDRRTREIHQVRREVLGKAWGKPLTGAPGSYTYSNTGYVLAGFVAEEVTGQSWETLIQREIAEPLGLTSLGFGPPLAPGAAWGHRSLLGFRRAVSPDAEVADNPPWLGPAGTLHLSLADLVSWGRVQLDACRGALPGFLSAEACQEMHREVAESYGLGWVVVEEESGPRSWHNGSNTMWYAILAVVPDQDLVLAVATNSFDHKPIDALTLDLFDALTGGGDARD